MTVPRKSPHKKLTNCSVCRLVITQGTPAAWQRGDPMGLVHTECATDPGAQPVDLSRAQGVHLTEKC